jgi:alpha-galactosidase
VANLWIQNIGEFVRVCGHNSAARFQVCQRGVGACRCHTFSDADTTEAVDCTSVARRISFTAHLNCIHEHITHESISLHNVLEAGFGVG